LVPRPQWELHLVKSFSLLEQITFQHGKKSFLSEDQVVQYLDTQNVACLSEPSSYILVLHARLEIATGMVVGNHDGSGTLTDCLRKYFRILQYKLQHLEQDKSALGLFKRQEKKAIQEEIDLLTSKLTSLTSKRDGAVQKIKERIIPIESELNEKRAELTKDR